MKQIEYYTTEDGKCPYVEWLEKLSPTFQVKILTRLDRLQKEIRVIGNLFKTVNYQNLDFTSAVVIEFILKNLMM